MMGKRKKPVAGSQKPVERRLVLVYFWLLVSGSWILLPSCSSNKKQPTTRPSNMSQRQDAALRDPFGYKPDMSRDVSGGDIGKLDRDGLKKDLNNVFNP
jgi:hypothetical protein